MRIDIVTLFPELFDGYLACGFVKKAIATGKLSVRRKSPREFGLGVHRSVDDTPYGGGSGMVMRVDCLVHTFEAFDQDVAERAHRVLLTPQGARFSQAVAEQLATRAAIMLICGRYEGFDERVRSFVDEELSIGDFVMTGGEVAAMAVIDTVVRLLPGVLGNPASLLEESHAPATGGLLEYAQYTRPSAFRGLEVPAVLKSGDHEAIARFRRNNALERTRARRPDIYAAYQRSRS